MNEAPYTLPEFVNFDAIAPAMFLVHAFDAPVPLTNSNLLAAAYKTGKIPCELHIYTLNVHRYGIARRANR